MKLVKYTLTSLGTIPSCILDGGYYATNSNNVPPQDLTLLGFAKDDCTFEEIADKESLISYLEEIGSEWVNDDGSEFSPTDAAESMWSQLEI